MNYNLPTTSKKERNSLAFKRDSMMDPAGSMTSVLKDKNTSIGQVESGFHQNSVKKSTEMSFETPRRDENQDIATQNISTIRTKLFQTPQSSMQEATPTATPSRSSSFSSTVREFSSQEEESGKEWIESFNAELKNIEKRSLN